MSEAREIRETIKNLYRTLPQMKAEIKAYEEERLAIMEALPVSGRRNVKVQQSEVSDPTHEKMLKLQKSEKRYLKTLLLVGRLESVHKILSDEERRLLKSYFHDGKSFAAIGRLLGHKPETIKRRVDTLSEKILFWIEDHIL